MSESLPATLDGSWGYALNMAHAQHLVFGRDLNFTYGPLACLNNPDPDLVSPLPVWLYWMAISVVFWYGAALCLVRLPSRFSAYCVCLTLAGAMVFSASYAERLQAAYLILVAAALASRTPLRTGECLLLSFLAAVSLLGKTNDGILALLLYYGLLATGFLADRRNWRERASGWTAALFAPVVFLLVLFVAAQGSLVSLPAYLWHAVQIAGGYSDAMSQAGPAWQLTLAIAAIVALFLAIPSVADAPAAWRRAVPFAGLVAFFAFKHAFVRQDQHADVFHIKLAAASVFLLVLAGTWRDRRLLNSFALLNLLLGILMLQSAPPHLFRYWLDQALSPRVMAAKVVDMLHFSPTWERLWAANRLNLAAHQLPAELPAIIGRGTVDSVPHDLYVLAANKLNWRPRPVIQSYAAYRPALDQLNAAHLDGPNAPDYLLVRWDNIDRRHPFLDDAASWRALCNRYDIALLKDSQYLLTRRRGPRFTEPRTIAHTAARFGDFVAVPSVGPGEFLVMRAQVHKSLYGSLRSLLFRVDPVYLNARYGSGATRRNRVTWANLADGALIGHLPEKLEQLAPYFGAVGSGLPDRVEEIRWETPSSRQFAPQIEIEWQTISFRPHETDPSALVERPRLSWTPLWQPGQPGVTSHNAVTAIGPTGLLVRPVTLNPQILFQLPQDLSRYRTLLIRARFSAADQVQARFSTQADDRALTGGVPVGDVWLDCLVNTKANRLWATEAGSLLRFDPSTSRVRGAVIEIRGVWGSLDNPFAATPEMAFYPVSENEVAKAP